MATLTDLRRSQRAMEKADLAAAATKARHQAAVEKVKAAREHRLAVLAEYINAGGADVFKDAAKAFNVTVPRIYQLFYGYQKAR